MKVLLDAQSLFPPRTGIGRVVQDIIFGLDSLPEMEAIGCYLSVFPFGKQWNVTKQILTSLQCSPKVSLHRIPLPLGILLSLWEKLSIPPIDLLIGGFDVVHGTSHVLPERWTIPTVLTVQDTSLLDHPEWYPPSATPLRSHLKKAIQKADRIHAPSHYVKECLINRYRNQPDVIDVVYNPFRGDFPVYSPEEKENLRKEMLGICDPYIVWIGEMNPRKNTQALAEILHSLRKRGYKSVRLVMMGPQGYRSDAFFQSVHENRLSIVTVDDSLRNRYGDIILTGYLPGENQKRNILASADCLIFPSRDEGFGYPILEAMSSGIPVIYPKAGSLPEIAGEAGLCVSSPDAIEEYADRIEEVLNNPSFYKAQVECGFKRKAFFANQPLTLLIDVYHKAIRQKR